ncbi:POK10 protein, partial [Amazona guildingii]|nr:POK10 protein [Amazona guildingii]
AHVKRHMLSAIAVFGIPHEVKTDNGPAYISKTIQDFFRLWGISHCTGIPHSRTGQAIIERSHQI